MYRIDLLRHGTTELSHTLRGSTDDALTAEGWQQMEQTLDQSLAAKMRWDAIFSSPLQRCHAFAAKAAAQLDLPLIPAPFFAPGWPRRPATPACLCTRRSAR